MEAAHDPEEAPEELAVILELPEPPSPNDEPWHPMQKVRWKNRTKKRTWFSALGQEMPVFHPPERVRIISSFRFHELRDEDNLVGSLKWVLDALRLPRGNESVAWREGLYERKGYFVDDAPRYCTIEMPTQTIARGRRGLTLEIGLRLRAVRKAAAV